uniref:Uncharacterized protein n=1 Tax=Piliocolobus tephrosceles TaxID=591936 RepID=A0A8C9GLK1_9PRIM
MNPSEMQRKAPPWRWKHHNRAPLTPRCRDDNGGFVEKKRGKCGEKKERSACYCVYIEGSRCKRLHLVLYLRCC